MNSQTLTCIAPTVCRNSIELTAAELALTMEKSTVSTLSMELLALYNPHHHYYYMRSGRLPFSS